MSVTEATHALKEPLVSEFRKRLQPIDTQAQKAISDLGEQKNDWEAAKISERKCLVVGKPGHTPFPIVRVFFRNEV